MVRQFVPQFKSSYRKTSFAVSFSIILRFRSYVFTSYRATRQVFEAKFVVWNERTEVPSC